MHCGSKAKVNMYTQTLCCADVGLYRPCIDLLQCCLLHGIIVVQFLVYVWLSISMILLILFHHVLFLTPLIQHSSFNTYLI